MEIKGEIPGRQNSRYNGPEVGRTARMPVWLEWI